MKIRDGRDGPSKTIVQTCVVHLLRNCWKTAPNASDITFDGRLSAARQ